MEVSGDGAEDVGEEEERMKATGHLLQMPFWFLVSGRRRTSRLSYEENKPTTVMTSISNNYHSGQRRRPKVRYPNETSKNRCRPNTRYLPVRRGHDLSPALA